MTPLTIRHLDHEQVTVAGDLTFASIDKKTVRALPLTKADKQIIIDLDQVTNTDSAGLALLIEWLKLARKKHTRLLFENIPAQLLELARANGFADLLRQSQ